MSKITDIGVKLVDVNGLNTFKESILTIIKNNKQIVEAALTNLDERINNLGELANVQAVDTGTVVDDVNVDYATVDYVNGLIGDINSVLENIING